jgi:hypothetical protein
VEAAAAGLPNEALERMIALYWSPVYRFIRLKFRKHNEDAKDLTQSVVASALECRELRMSRRHSERMDCAMKVIVHWPPSADPAAPFSARKAPVEIFVIDHIDRTPAAN